MSTILRGSKLIENCTPSIDYDNQVQAGCSAFDNQMYEIIDDTGQVVMIPNIMSLTDSKLIDILAWQFHVDFYDPTKSLEFRKQLVQLSIVWHKTKGTVALVNQVLAMFYPGPPPPYITEWWQYFNPLPPNFPTVQADELMATFRPSDVNVDQNTIFFAGTLQDGMPVILKLGPGIATLPAPLVVGTTYYVANWTLQPVPSFQLAASAGGAPINLTSQGTGDHNELWNHSIGGGNWHNRYRFRVIIDGTVIPDSEVPTIIELIGFFKPISRWPEGIASQSKASNGSVYVFAFAMMTVRIQSAAAAIRT
jgi:phage tail P2-like protein